MHFNLKKTLSMGVYINEQTIFENDNKKNNEIVSVISVFTFYLHI